MNCNLMLFIFSSVFLSAISVFSPVSNTHQATFCGSTLGSKSGQHFTTADYESMGYHLCDTLLDYCDPDVSKVRNSRKESM